MNSWWNFITDIKKIEENLYLSCDAMLIMAMNYITKDPITLSYCLVQVVYSLQEEVVLPDDEGAGVVNLSKLYYRTF